MAEAGFWDDNDAAQTTIGQLKGLKIIVGPLDELSNAVEDLSVLFEMADEDESIVAEVSAEIERLEEILGDLELKALLSGPNDGAGAILSINARDGGTDANDWADMMLRMYSAWAVGQDYKIQLLDRSDNEEAGINYASIAIRGPMAYGYLKGEEGIHRLVRISPFNSEGKRQTSFAAVSVSPEIDDSIEVEIDGLPVASTMAEASIDGAHPIHTDRPGNRLATFHAGDGKAEVVARIQASAHRRSLEFRIGRLAGAPMEPRGLIAEMQDDRLVVWTSTQAPHAVRDGLASVLGWPRDRIRVVVPDVGGGFGLKDHPHDDELLACVAAVHTGCRVAWIESRTESLTVTTQARDEAIRVAAAAWTLYDFELASGDCLDCVNDLANAVARAVAEVEGAALAAF